MEGFVKSLKPKSKGKFIKLRDYQIDAIEYALKSHRGLLVSPTASGKSLIIYSLVRYYKMMGLKTLILVPTTSLVEQMYSDFEDYGWSSGTYCQKIYQGYDKKVEKDVVISTWQSIYKMPKKYFEQFGCVIGDEAHLFKSKSLTNIMTKLHLCKYRFGLSTPSAPSTYEIVKTVDDVLTMLKDEIYTRYKQGEAVIDKNYAYTEFVQGNKFLGNMLYDMQNDKKQNIDISKLPENKELVKKYSIKLEEMRTYVNEDPFQNR